MSCTMGMKSVSHDPAHEGLLMLTLGFGRKRMRASSVLATAGTGVPEPNPGKTPGQAEGDRETAEENLRDRKKQKEHGRSGITDLPPDAEESQQSDLPPRGSRKGNDHA